jgi:carotenoid cleavage dioxygenase
VPTFTAAATLTRAGAAHEEITATDLPVTGDLPVGLDGCCLRIGPNPVRPIDPLLRHSFVGDGMVYGVRLREGRAEWYRTRWVRTDRVCRELGRLPLPGPRHGLSDNANVNVIRHGGRTLALGEAGVLPVQLDDELDSVSRNDFDGTLPNGFAGHPVCDPVTGELFSVAYYHELSVAQYLVIDVAGRVRRCEPIAVTGTPMMHSLFLTDRHVVFPDLPVAFDPELAGSGSRCPYSWVPDRPARLGVLRREGRGGDVRWFDVDPCFVFHPVNAYEDGDRLIVDVLRYERVFHTDRLRPSETAPMLWRWTIDLADGRVTEQQCDDVPEEFPRIDERRTTMPYRYAYTAGVRVGPGHPRCDARLRKRDLRTGHVDVHDFGPGREAGEAVFVPSSPMSAEDDGWLLSFVDDPVADRTDLVVLNADDFTGPPQAVVHLPTRVPRGLHTNWIGY